nr:hypothetical protein [uncultured Sphingomonas sp.]
MGRHFRLKAAAAPDHAYILEARRIAASIYGRRQRFTACNQLTSTAVLFG